MPKHGQKPTRTQRKALMDNGYDPMDYEYVQMKGSDYIFRSKSDGSLITVSPD